MDVVRPVCKRCNRAWRWPRNLSHVNLDLGQPKHIKPTTQSTVVAYLGAVAHSDPPTGTIPPEVFENIEFTWSGQGMRRMSNRLVTEFQFVKDTGAVRYDIGNEEVDQLDIGYSRLVTLNSWYDQLFWCLINIALTVMDYYVNFLLIVSLFMPEANGWPSDIQKAVGNMKYPFSSCWIAMLAIQFCWSAWVARWEWYYLSNPQRGDLIINCSLFDRVRAFAALVFFIFFDVEDSLRNIVTRLHPWKSVQPYCAFKANGTRA
eukprot:TRINITY_DN90719_c0_g1_i1.p1 TRINITY_DN90719_c0_g1~~TRINITY_DN90719_c0_g1_i1.p1  ORF type:complete len:268 (-),score=13.60 TRINITY_DN90719_c0_g1_i1:18-800(-)